MAIRLGTNGNNTIRGTNAADLILGFGGDDIVDGGAGNDLIFGGAGSDLLNGGAGSDFLDGGSGNDTLVFTAAPQTGRDTYNGGAGADTLVIEFTAARWADAAVKADVIAYLDSLLAGQTGQFLFQSLNLAVSGIESLVIRVDSAVIDPREGNTVPSGHPTPMLPMRTASCRS